MSTDTAAQDLIERLQPIAKHALGVKGGLGEQNTKYKIVIPVLEALGWKKEHMDFEYAVGGQSVDIALCDDDEKPVVFVEVKGLSVSLKPDAKEVDQALGYAFKAGNVRWAVLTNGLLWWAYDCHAKLPSDRRRFLDVDLSRLESNPKRVAEPLLLLSPDSVSGGALASWAARELCRLELLRLFQKPDDPLVDFLLDKIGIGDATALREVLSHLSRTPFQAVIPSGSRKGTPPAPPEPGDLLQWPPLGKRGPWTVRIAGREYPQALAKHLLVLAAEYLVVQGLLTVSKCPVKVTRGNRYLVHTQPVHEDGKPFLQPELVGREMYIETHCSAANALTYARRLFQQFGLSPDDVELKGKGIQED
ncbi:MAG: type I restriction enzyme HsdR N-terminal domain-containing protein [Armatimonadota bacterium]